ncbi:hypothetical protein KCP73_07290 [Salmonella enterica subsp. enterica]|nr:hypothetical protein KCP73_07290 [Salmonella enterica subsp. enterica]
MLLPIRRRRPLPTAPKVNMYRFRPRYCGISDFPRAVHSVPDVQLRTGAIMNSSVLAFSPPIFRFL